MTFPEFVALARECRRAGRAYHANPSPANLGTAKAAEKALDRALAEVDRGPGLFREGPEGERAR